MNRFMRKRIGQFVDALAWRGMHAIARRKELELTPHFPHDPAASPTDPNAIFPEPSAQPLQHVHGTSWRKRGGTWRRDFTFPSAWPSQHAANNTVYVRAYAPEPKPDLPGVVVLHGLMNLTTAAYHPFLQALVANGAAAYILELPYHHRRTPPGSISGDLFHTVDLALTRHAVQQSVADVRLLLRLLRERKAPVLGVLGFSLGAWIGSLVACCEAHLDFAMLGMPPNNLNALVWRTALGAQLCRRFVALGWSPESTADFYASLDPLSYRPLLAPERIQLYAAEFDTLIALEQVHALRQKWGMPSLRTYAHGHLTIMISKQLHRDFREDFARMLNYG